MCIDCFGLFDYGIHNTIDLIATHCSITIDIEADCDRFFSLRNMWSLINIKDFDIINFSILLQKCQQCFKRILFI